MKLSVVAFGIARDILGVSKMEFVFQGETIGELKNRLVEEHDKFADLASISFAVNEEYQQDDFRLSEDDEVVIIPPVSGG